MSKRKNPDLSTYTISVFLCDSPHCGMIHLDIEVDDQHVCIPIRDEIWNALMVDVANLQKGTVN